MTPVPDLIEIFQRKMNSDETIDESTLEILPEGLPPWLTVLMVIAYTGLALFFSYRLLQRRRLT